jgi:hypothetical protein
MVFTAVAKGVDMASVWGYETTFGTLATTINQVFGNGNNVNVNQNNNTERLYALGSRNAQKLVTKRYDGTWNTSFTLGNAYWLKAVMGTKSAETGVGPYTRIYQENNTCPSISISNAFNLDTDSQHNVLGAKMNSMSLDCNVGETIKVKLDGMFQKLTKTTTLATTYSGDTEDPMIFSGASINLGSTATVDVQSLNITINNNTEMLFGLGSRFATKGVEKQREYNFTINEAYEDDSLLHDNFLGSATTPVTNPANVTSLVATFTNGLTSTYQRTLVATFNTLQLPTYDYTVDINEITKENASLQALSCSGISYINNSATSP